MSDLSKKITEILSNEPIREAFAACTGKEDVLKLLAEHGVETTESELKEALMQQIQRTQAAGIDGELSEELLEQVAGGSFWDKLLFFLGFFVPGGYGGQTM